MFMTIFLMLRCSMPGKAGRTLVLAEFELCSNVTRLSQLFKNHPGQQEQFPCPNKSNRLKDFMELRIYRMLLRGWWIIAHSIDCMEQLLSPFPPGHSHLSCSTAVVSPNPISYSR
jgi:hypothetical protein